MMAGRSHHRQAAKAYRLFAAPAAAATGGGDEADEFSESDIWGCSVEPAPDLHRGRGIVPAAARGKRSGPAPADRRAAAAVAASSMPVNIPDWSKILGGCAESGFRGKKGGFWWAESGDEGEEEEDDEEERRVPPHELLWRTRAASMSVHEGIGRTLKGRDLSRVRNAVWEITGFQ